MIVDFLIDDLKDTMMERSGFLCCICGEPVTATDTTSSPMDGYSLQVRKFGTQSPGMMWAHGPCLRRVIPVVGEEIPEPQKS